MTYDAITIDTSVVYSNSKRLDRGLVEQLSQFKNDTVQVILTEVVAREIKKMLVEQATKSLKALEKAIKQVGVNGQLSDDQRNALQTAYDALNSAEEYATDQLDRFVSDTGAKIIPADRAAMKEVLSAYFDKKPPFSTKGKKDEFPDAISLLSLESWADENLKKVLAVSGDRDWKAFADQSNQIDVVEDLGGAISTIVSATDALAAEAIKVVQQLVYGEPAELKAQLDEKLSNAVEGLALDVDFDASTHAVLEYLLLSLLTYKLNPLGDESYIEIVRVGRDSFVMRVPVGITASASADIKFFVEDHSQNDVNPGVICVEREVEFAASALITCIRDVDDDDPEQTNYKITEAELVDAPLSVYLGYVDYFLEEDDFVFDLGNLRGVGES